MGYKIRYRPPLNAGKNQRKISKQTIRIVYFLAIIILSIFIGKHINLSVMRELFIPGHADVTSTAFAEMTEHIRHGVGLKEAFTDFCLEIIEDARIS